MHRKKSNYLKVIGCAAPFDMAMHCGDAEGNKYVICETAGCPVGMAAENNDFLPCSPMKTLSTCKTFRHDKKV